MYNIMQITQRDVMTAFTVIPQSNTKRLIDYYITKPKHFVDQLDCALYNQIT